MIQQFRWEIWVLHGSRVQVRGPGLMPSRVNLGLGARADPFSSEGSAIPPSTPLSKISSSLLQDPFKTRALNLRLDPSLPSTVSGNGSLVHLRVSES